LQVSKTLLTPWHNFLIIAIGLALAGCSDEFDRDLVACESSAPESVSEEDLASYLRE